MTEIDTSTAEQVDPDPRASGRSLVRTLIVVIVAFALVGAGAVGWLVRGGGDSAGSPGTSSVDAGFARDMSTHHGQAIVMAGYERDNTSDPALQVLATDIETSQQFQLGEMEGWLIDWGLPFDTPQPEMTWMGDVHAGHLINGLMPGMATPSQMNRLQTLHGRPLDVFFLQLMIHHHQGGLAMAQYALTNASQPYVRDLAQAMVNAQTSEIIEMEQILRRLGSEPLPPPT